MMNAVPFAQVARLAKKEDNVAIALRELTRGTAVKMPSGQTIQLQHRLLEGHRFAIKPILPQTPLLSWNIPFAIATQPIAAGEAVINDKTLQELQSRYLGDDLPSQPNFADQFAPYQLPSDFRPAAVSPPTLTATTFLGYRRPAGRGVGTRNVVLLLATNAHANSFVNALEERLTEQVANLPTLDGIKAVTHTEGSTATANNRELVLRTLAGFVVHPNVAALLIVDYGDGIVNNDALKAYMEGNDYPLTAVLHQFLTVQESFTAELSRAAAIVHGWLPQIGQMQRTAESIAHLRIALQCGGSDAFSGISGNPLIGWVANRLVQQGGSAVLAETDELIGAEAYIVAQAKSRAVAEQFVQTVERFKAWAKQHGVSPEGNPSGGNRLRGLYNISLKSLGAAMKKHPDTVLAGVLAYSERPSAPGYYFMDSPGNDLESIAGQVAAGCSLIFFVTGNGSITNFPFVPTLKVVTTTRRFEQLEAEMDINAGAYLDGASLAELGKKTAVAMRQTASGKLSQGELAGHAQVQIWRDWPLGRYESRPVTEARNADLASAPIAVEIAEKRPSIELKAAAGNVGLILPTSLCSGQVARLAVARLNQSCPPGIERFVTLVHTEGCGASSNTAVLFDRTLLGYIRHPLVQHCLLLEHGCEKTHNDYFRQRLAADEQVGFASIQQDGGILNVLDKMADWFATAAKRPVPLAPPSSPRIGIAIFGALDEAADKLSILIQTLLAAGCTVVLPQHNPAAGLLPAVANHPPTLAYGQPATSAGLHLMQMPTVQWGELLTGMGVTTDLFVAYSGRQAPQGHPLIPLLRIGQREADFDALLSEGVLEMVAKIGQMLAGTLESKLKANTFQLARGELGISL